jgi:hypothetical protein
MKCPTVRSPGRNLSDFSRLKGATDYQAPPSEEVMANILVRRNQFNIYSGITRLGQLGSEPLNNGKGFRAEDVQRIMRELWTEYVTGNPQLFKPAELRRADPGAAGCNWPDANRHVARSNGPSSGAS